MKITKILLSVFLISGISFSGQTVVTKIVTGTVKTGYFNAGNSIQVVVTFNGNDVKNGSADKTGETIKLYVGFNNSSSVSTIDQLMSGSSSPVGWSQADGGSDGDNVCTFYVSDAQLSSNYGGNEEGLYFDFAVTIGSGSAVGSGPEDSGVSHKIDRIAPYVTSLTYPGTDNRGFNLQKIVYSLNEAVIAGSYFIFDGYGGGDTGDHKFNLAGSNAGTGTKTIDPITFDEGENLVENATYYIDFYGIDAAGNARTQNEWRDNVVYDKTRARIASAATSKADDSYKIGDVIPVTLTFSESIFTDGTMRVTFDTDQYVDVGNFASYGSRVTTITFNYTIAEGATTNDLTIKTIAMQSGNIIDLSLIHISEPTRPY